MEYLRLRRGNANHILYHAVIMHVAPILFDIFSLELMNQKFITTLDKKKREVARQMIKGLFLKKEDYFNKN